MSESSRMSRFAMCSPPSIFPELCGRSRVSAAIVSALVISACSADAVTPPEPTLETPGAFAVATDDSGVTVLFRTLQVVRIDDTESLLEAIVYAGEPASPEQAKAWAKDRDLPVAQPHALFSLRGLLSLELEPEVVWFRTVTEDERDALR
jgi:hypothetical protein